jgi:hypothetical protein
MTPRRRRLGHLVPARARIAADGAVLEERASRAASSPCRPAAFPPCCRKPAATGCAPRCALCLVSGMAGSRQGWREAPYCACPAGFDRSGAQPPWIEPGRIALVPGLSCEHDGVPDVMRGEEVQVFGAMDLLRPARWRVRAARHPQQVGARARRPRAVLRHLHVRRVLCAAAPAFDPGAHDAAEDGRSTRGLPARRAARAGERQPAAQRLQRPHAGAVRPAGSAASPAICRAS